MEKFEMQLLSSVRKKKQEAWVLKAGNRDDSWKLSTQSAKFAFKWASVCCSLIADIKIML
jgi:hypothetical protein